MNSPQSKLLKIACERFVNLTDTYPQLAQVLCSALKTAREDAVGATVNLSASGDEEPLSLRTQLTRRRKAWTVRELADLLSLSDRSLYDQIQNGALTASKISSIFRVCPADALEWYKARIINPTPRR